MIDPSQKTAFDAGKAIAKALDAKAIFGKNQVATLLETFRDLVNVHARLADSNLAVSNIDNSLDQLTDAVSVQGAAIAKAIEHLADAVEQHE